MNQLAAIVAISLFASAAGAQNDSVPSNPAIDMPGFLRVSLEAAEARESRRLSEADFIRMSRERGTIVLDARSREKFDELHVKGAVHLSFPDIAIDSLQQTIPDKATRILIYCNNNFLNAEEAFPTKLPLGLAQPLDLRGALQLWLSKHLRARTAARHQDVEDRNSSRRVVSSASAPSIRPSCALPGLHAHAPRLPTDNAARYRP